VTFCATFAVTFAVLDLAIDRGAFLLNFRQSWMSHFAPAVTAAYGSPSDHRFPFALLLKNWDMTIPAVLGIILLLRRARKAPLEIIPVAWLALALTVFATHTPWWSYYYVHIAIPLSWCAGSGIAFMMAATPKKVAAALWPARSTRLSLRRRFGVIAVFAVYLTCAIPWMAARTYLQISGIRQSPQTYYALVLNEIDRFKPFTDWIYTDNLTYSFYSGVPIPPQLAVVSLKRLWSGEITEGGVAAEMQKYKPGLIALRNDTRELPFQTRLNAEYRLVYHDAENRLYAHQTIAKKPDL